MERNTQLPSTSTSRVSRGDTRLSRNNQKWQSLQEDIYRIYMIEDQTLAKTMSSIKEKYDFEASERTWKSKLKEWKYEKNIPVEAMKLAIAKAEQRAKQEGKRTAIYYSGSLITPQKIETFKKRKVVKESDPMSPTAETPQAINYFTPPADDNDCSIDVVMAEPANDDHVTVSSGVFAGQAFSRMEVDTDSRPHAAHLDTEAIPDQNSMVNQSEALLQEAGSNPSPDDDDSDDDSSDDQDPIFFEETLFADEFSGELNIFKEIFKACSIFKSGKRHYLDSLYMEGVRNINLPTDDHFKAFEQTQENDPLRYLRPLQHLRVISSRLSADVANGAQNLPLGKYTILTSIEILYDFIQQIEQLEGDKSNAVSFLRAQIAELLWTQGLFKNATSELDNLLQSSLAVSEKPLLKIYLQATLSNMQATMSNMQPPQIKYLDAIHPLYKAISEGEYLGWVDQKREMQFHLIYLCRLWPSFFSKVYLLSVYKLALEENGLQRDGLIPVLIWTILKTIQPTPKTEMFFSPLLTTHHSSLSLLDLARSSAYDEDFCRELTMFLSLGIWDNCGFGGVFWHMEIGNLGGSGFFIGFWDIELSLRPKPTTAICYRYQNNVHEAAYVELPGGEHKDHVETIWRSW